MDLSKVTIPLTTLGAIVGVTFGSFLWAESHYATAADVNQKLDSIKQEIRTQRAQQLQDQIYILENKPNRTAQDDAAIHHYELQLQQLMAQDEAEKKAEKK